MNEKQIFKRVLVLSLALIIFSALYCLGGMDGHEKWLRRFLAPSILVGAMFWSSRDPRVLLQLPFMFASLSLGYGADLVWSKILKRFMFGAANGLSFNIHNLWQKKYLWSGFHFVLVVGAYIVLGVWNPLHARIEEFMLALLTGSTVLTYGGKR